MVSDCRQTRCWDHPSTIFPLKLNCIQKFLRNLRFCSFPSVLFLCIVYIEIHGVLLLFQRFFLSFLFVSDRLFYSLLHVGYLLLFLYIFPKHDVLSLLHDSCFLYIWISVDIFHIDIHSFYILCIHPCLLYCILESDFLDRCNNHSIHHKHIHIS